MENGIFVAGQYTTIPYTHRTKERGCHLALLHEESREYGADEAIALGAEYIRIQVGITEFSLRVIFLRQLPEIRQLFI